MNVYVYPTDHDWFRFLRARSPVDEVNFWQPGGTTLFTRLDPGELFLFRLKHPINKIAGGGIFRHSSLFPLKLAWDSFGEKNGVPDFSSFFSSINRYRAKQSNETLSINTNIGCIILQQPFFLSEDQWIDVPAEYHSNLVQGKRFDINVPGPGKGLFTWAASKLQAEVPSNLSVHETPSSMYGEPALVRPRLGQGTFRVLVSDAYERKCVITGEKTLPVLEASHIRPVSLGGQHRIDNGLLLRSDIHTLFDMGYVTITPRMEFKVSSKLREEWQNGVIYYALAGNSIRTPKSEVFKPRAEFLEWHNDTVFRS